MKKESVPKIFAQLEADGCISRADVHPTDDGFFAVFKSLSDILLEKNIRTYRNEAGQERLCDRFFDDWFLYAVAGEEGAAYSLFKLREQEFDGSQLPADGDTPGATVCFIIFDVAALLRCLAAPTEENKRALSEEINRVVAAQGQQHAPELKDYFIRPQAKAPYLIAELYTRQMAKFTKNGALPVPLAYAALADKKGRLPRFIEENNLAAGGTVCDHSQIFLKDPQNLSLYEKLAILATHTGNTSFHSFAAEVRYHASFLTGLANLRLPGMSSSPYASAIRADMSVDDKEFEGFAPYHDPDSKLLREQRKYHGEY